MSLVDLCTQAKASNDPSALLGAIPYARWLGLSVEPGPSDLLFKLKFSDMIIGNPAVPALHGGTVAALLETAATIQALWTMETVLLPKTVSITVDYVRPGRPMDTFARATVTRQGRRVVNVRADAWQEDRSRTIASATVHFLVLAAE